MIFDLLKLRKSNNFDLYATSRELTVSGLTEKARKQIDDLSTDLENAVKCATKTEIYKKSVVEKNYGSGADWPVALVEFVAHSDFLRAIATTGGLITFSNHIVNIFKKLLEKNEPRILLGMKTAEFFAVKYISDDADIKNIKLIKSFELNRGEMGFTAKEFVFIFSVNELELGVQEKFNKDRHFNGTLYLLHLNWLGDLKSIKKY